MQRLQRLNRSPNVRNGLDINPVTRPSVTLYGDTMNLGDPLDADELDIFKAQFATILAAPGSAERNVMLDRLPVYMIALRAIKYDLKGPKFKGLNPEDTEIGFGILRPQFTKHTVGGVSTYRADWTQVFAAAATWTDFLASTAAVPFAVGQDFGLCVTHMKSLVTPRPFFAEVRFVIGRTGILIPGDVRNLVMADTINNIALVPIPSIIARPKTNLYGRALSDAIGTGDCVLGGLVIGLGRALKEEVATWV